MTFSETFENSRFRVGDSFSFTKRIEEKDIDSFAQLTGDVNPLHMDSDYAKKTSFRKRVVHGMLIAGITSRLVGMHVPGTGALWSEQNFQFKSPVFIGDVLDFKIKVLQISESTQTSKIQIEVTNQNGSTVLAGDGIVMMIETKEQIMTPKLCKVAFITGASRGIGRAIALKLAENGISVGVNYHSSEKAAREVVEYIEQNGGKACALRADVRSQEEVFSAVQKCCEFFKAPVDLLVSNAGINIISKNFSEAQWQDYEDHWNIQVKGAFNCLKAVLDRMLEQKFGKIILISSTLAWSVPVSGMNHYTTAKSALTGFGKALASEMGPKGITVNIVSPGMTETDLQATIPERMKKIAASQVPLRRLATPEDVANVVLFLAKEDASYLHGVDIPVAGGAVMR